MSTFDPHGTTILCVRRGGRVAMGGDGQVTLGNTVMKGNARKVRRLHEGKVHRRLRRRHRRRVHAVRALRGQAAAVRQPDARRDRAGQGLAHRPQPAPPRGAARASPTPTHSLIISGNGDVIEPEHDLMAVGSGGAFAQAAALALLAQHRPRRPRDRRAGARHRGRHLHLHQPQRTIEEFRDGDADGDSKSRERSAEPSHPLSPTPSTMSSMTPREIVQELDKHIVGQDAAKRAVAIALRNRWRRMQVDEALRAEITPKNILMIGPTGVGKTEIARRLARLADAPFIKVEATKFTEVGYVGRDVDSIIRDLVDVAVKLTREAEIAKVRHRAMDAAEERVLDALLPRPRAGGLRRRARAAARRRHAPAVPQDAARGPARRPRDRDRGARHAGGRRDHGAARHGGDVAAAAGHVPEPRRAALAPAQAARCARRSSC